MLRPYAWLSARGASSDNGGCEFQLRAFPVRVHCELQAELTRPRDDVRKDVALQVDLPAGVFWHRPLVDEGLQRRGVPGGVTAIAEHLDAPDCQPIGGRA